MGTVRVSYDSRITSAIIDVDYGDQGYEVTVPDSRAVVGTKLWYVFIEMCSYLTSNKVDSLIGETTPEVLALIAQIQGLVNEQTETVTNRFVGQQVALIRAFSNDAVGIYVAREGAPGVTEVFSVPDELFYSRHDLATLCGQLISKFKRVFPTICVSDMTEEIYAILDQIATIVDEVASENS